MTTKELEFWKRQRALLIEFEKALTEQRGAVIGQRKSIETMIADAQPTEPHAPMDNEVITTRTPYTA